MEIEGLGRRSVIVKQIGNLENGDEECADLNDRRRPMIA